MSDSDSVCLVCLQSYISLETVGSNDAENVNTVTEVKYILPELAILDPEIPLNISKQICSSCRTILHSFYTFKNRCLEIYSRLIRNSKVLQNTSATTQEQSVDELQIRTYNSEPMIKQEQEVHIEFMSVKEENEDSLLLMEEQDDQKTDVEDRLVVKEEFIISDDSADFGILDDVDSFSEHSEILNNGRKTETYTSVAMAKHSVLFYNKIEEYYSDLNKKKPWTTAELKKIAAEILLAKQTPGKKSRRQYHVLSLYDVLEIADKQIVIKKQKHGEDNQVFIVSYEDLFYILYQTHISVGHGGRDKMIHTLQGKYDVPRYAVEKLIATCEVCQKKRNKSHANLTIKPNISQNL